MKRLLVLLVACGGSDGPSDELSLSNKVGANATIDRIPLKLVKSGHLSNNRGIALGLMWFSSTALEDPPWGDLQIQFIEPPAVKTHTIVTKQFQDLLPGEATVEYTEDGLGDHRGWHAPSGTIQMTEASGATVAIELTNVAMVPNPVDVFGPGVGTFDLSARIRTTSYDPN